MATKKHELEYQIALIQAEKFNTVAKLIRTVFLALATLGAIWLVFDGLEKVIGSQSPDGISAFAKVLEALKLGSIIGYMWGFGATAAWYRERKGKQRIIREKSSLQRTMEADDEYRTSSGLTEVGGTPVRETR